MRSTFIPRCAACLPACLTDCLTDWLSDWLTDWLPACLLPACLTDWLTDWLTAYLPACLTDWLTDWLPDWLPDWLTDWLTAYTCLPACLLLACLPASPFFHSFTHSFVFNLWRHKALKRFTGVGQKIWSVSGSILCELWLAILLTSPGLWNHNTTCSWYCGHLIAKQNGSLYSWKPSRALVRK